MGIRCTQIIGLKTGAEVWLDSHCEKITTIDTCPRCKHELSKLEHNQKIVYDDSGSSGMFEDGPVLCKYSLRDGSEIKEIEQCSPWSSGPCIFLCLEKEDGTRLFEWTEKEIENEL